LQSTAIQSIAMSKSKNRDRPNELNPSSFMHKPHDRYLRFVLQNKQAAMELIQFALPAIFGLLQADSIELSDDSFLDDNLREHFSDVCYHARFADGTSVRISLIFEHKSEKPDLSILVQLLRYIGNIWSMDEKQGRPLSFTIPIVVYHGLEQWPMETTATLFPNVPEAFYRYAPTFEYVLVDIQRLSDETIDTLHFLLLRNILLALKHSRDEQYLAQNWRKVVIFAAELRDQNQHLEIFKATLIYLSRTSQVFNKNIVNMDHILSAAEQQVVKPHIIQLCEEQFEKGLSQGLEKGLSQGLEKGLSQGMESAILTFMRANSDWTNEKIASTFDVKIELVKRLRTMLAR
jgi:predicted transposase/invertase (TIGR01784 family)